MTAYSIDATDKDVTYDYTGLVSGHPRPIRVQEAYDDMIAAWADYMAMTDKFCDGLASHDDIQRMLERAQAADRDYQFIYLTWEVAQGECTCHPVTGNACPACTARHYIELGDEMPY